MIELIVIVLSIAYALVAALLLNMNLVTPYSVWLKAGVILLTSVLYLGTWFGYQGLTGWATNQSLPEDFRLIYLSIDERKSASDGPGYIYYWVRPLDEAGLPFGPPRAHRIEWSEAEAENAEAALSEIEEGAELNGTWSRNLMAPQDDGEMLSDYAGELSVAGGSEGMVNIRFMRAPPRSLPPKSAPR